MITASILDPTMVFCYYKGTPLILDKDMWVAAKMRGESKEYCDEQKLDEYKKQLDYIHDGLIRVCGGEEIGDQDARLREALPKYTPMVHKLVWAMNIAALIKTGRIKNDDMTGWLYSL